MGFTLLKLDEWVRKEHFEFFSAFEEPFHSVTVKVDVSKAYARSKELACSFFLYYLHASLQAVNQVDAFRYRINDGEVRVYDRIHASATINRSDNTFDFSFIPFCEKIADFLPGAIVESERIRKGSGLNPGVSGLDVVHFSALPWLDFTSLTHARSFSFKDSVPKISFGKVTESSDGKKLMPVSVHVHHGLVDGVHVAAFFGAFQKELDRK